MLDTMQGFAPWPLLAVSPLAHG